MRFAVVASALFAGFVAASPVVTETIQSTQAVTITSCGPEVTNCPARTQSASSVVSSVPTPMAVANTSAPAAPFSTVTLYSTQAVTITSCAPEVTNCPARSSSMLVSVGTTVVPVVPSGTAPANMNVGPSASAPAPFAMQNSTMPAYKPTGTGASVSATFSGPATFTGAASNLNAGMALAGVAGFAALLI